VQTVWSNSQHSQTTRCTGTRASERMTTCRHCACLVDVWVEEGEKDYYFHDCEHPTHDHRAEPDLRIPAVFDREG
jgi:hypothetical protein